MKAVFDEAWSFCGQEAYHQAHLFLIRQLCNCYGTNTIEMLSQHHHLQWVKPRELRKAVSTYFLCSVFVFVPVVLISSVGKVSDYESFQLAVLIVHVRVQPRVECVKLHIL